MFITEPAKRVSDTEGVLPTYNFSDIKFVRKQIIEFCTAVNANKKGGDPHLDMQKIIRTASRRIAKHQGLQSRYRGDGSLRE